MTAVGPRIEPSRQVWRLTERQAEIWRARERFLVLVSGRRFGKTTLAVLWLLNEVLGRETGSLGYYVAPYHVMAKAIAWDMLCEMTRGMRVGRNASELSITLPGARKIVLKGADDPETLEGVGLVAVVLDEFGRMKLQAWEKSLRPALADRNGRALICGKPRGHNHLKEFYDRGQPGPQRAEGWRSWLYTSAQGGFVPAADIAEAKRTLPTRAFRQEFEATFEALAGRVYDEFLRPTHVVPYAKLEAEYRDGPRWRFRRVVVGVDWGRVNPGAMVVCGVTGTGRIVVLHEEYHRDLLVNDTGWHAIARKIRERFGPLERFVADPSEPGNITSLRLALDARPVVENAQNSVADGIARVSVKLLARSGQPDLIVSDTCVNLIREFESYTWRDVRGDAVEEPDPKCSDHALDALRYAVMAVTDATGRGR